MKNMDRGFYFWFSIVSLAINALLIMVSVGLLVANRKEKERRNSQVKIWMQGANGVHQALGRIIQDKWNGLYSTVQDVVNAVNAVQPSAFAQYQSLYEERALSEDEWKKEQSELRNRLRNPNANQQQATSPAATTTTTPAAAELVKTPTVKRGRLRRILSRIFSRKKRK